MIINVANFIVAIKRKILVAFSLPKIRKGDTEIEESRKLDRHIPNELIDKIFVYEKEIIDGEVVQTVEIFYNFLLNTKELNIKYHL